MALFRPGRVTPVATHAPTDIPHATGDIRGKSAYITIGAAQ